MEITWYGHSCFRLTERGMASVVTDPYNSEAIGYSPLKLKGDVVTVSHNSPGHNYVEAVSNHTYTLFGPGEYEIGGVFIIGAAMFDKTAEEPQRNVVYVMDFGGITVAHLGDLDHIPNQSQVDALGEIDVVLIPVGAGQGLHASQAAEVISLLEPSVVIPMHYQTEHSTLELEGVERFLKEMGVTTPIEEETLKISRSSLPEQTQIVLLSVKE